MLSTPFVASFSVDKPQLLRYEPLPAERPGHGLVESRLARTALAHVFRVRWVEVVARRQSARATGRSRVLVPMSRAAQPRARAGRGGRMISVEQMDGT